jgi:dipicolinate synthase subunit A
MRAKTYTVLGGDLRSLKLAEFLSKDGNIVNIYGFKNAEFKGNFFECEDIEKALSTSDVVLGPIPCSNDDENIYAPFSDNKISISEIFRLMNHKQLFLSGRISEKILHKAEVFNVYCIDLLKREELSILNSIPTAEGAIQIAMEEMPITLHGCKAMVLGFGRIGKVLSKMLVGIGTDVYVEARKYSDISWVDAYSYNSVNLCDLDKYLGEMDVIFNTIPSLILDINKLKLLKSDCLLIDLASKPGGVDFEAASKIGVKTIWALSLPGKVAPVTAGKYIKDTVKNVLEELGV